MPHICSLGQHMLPRVHEDKQRIKSRFGHTNVQFTLALALTLAHPFLLKPLIPPFVNGVLKTYRDTVHFDRHTVRYEVIVFVMVQFLIKLTGVWKSLAHDRTGRVILLFTDKQVNVSPLSSLRFGIECRQSGTFHQYRHYTGLLQCCPGLRQGMMQVHMLLHCMHAYAFHERPRVRRNRRLTQYLRIDQRTRPLLRVQK